VSFLKFCVLWVEKEIALMRQESARHAQRGRAMLLDPLIADSFQVVGRRI
jgi:hypothetical protein